VRLRPNRRPIWRSTCGFGVCSSAESSGSSASTLEQCVQALGFNGVSDCQTWLATATQGEALAMAVLLVSILPP
jgi:hypothetical protein